MSRKNGKATEKGDELKGSPHWPDKRVRGSPPRQLLGVMRPTHSWWYNEVGRREGDGSAVAGRGQQEEDIGRETVSDPKALLFPHRERTQSAGTRSTTPSEELGPVAEF